MSDKIIKGVVKGIVNEILYFADAALKSGAVNVGKQLTIATRDVNQPSEVDLGTITNALKNGIMATSQDLMEIGLERVKALSPQDQESTISEKSTQTPQSEEGK